MLLSSAVCMCECVCYLQLSVCMCVCVIFSCLYVCVCVIFSCLYVCVCYLQLSVCMCVCYLQLSVCMCVCYLQLSVCMCVLSSAVCLYVCVVLAVIEGEFPPGSSQAYLAAAAAQGKLGSPIMSPYTIPPSASGLTEPPHPAHRLHRSVGQLANVSQLFHSNQSF